MKEVYTINHCYVYGIRKAEIVSTLSSSHVLVKYSDTQTYEGMLSTMYRQGVKRFRRANKQGAAEINIIGGGYDYYY